MADRKSHRLVMRLALAGIFGGTPLVIPMAAARQGTTPLIGVVRETEVRVSPELNGRLVAIHVAPGQPVKRGDLLAELSSPELAASVEYANAAALHARTERDDVLAGVRREEVAIAAEDLTIAQSNVVLARQQ